jgi:hypothetical protein
MSKSSPLQQVIGSIQSQTLLPIVVFDLDDTLFSTARRNLVVIQNFAADEGDEFPDFAKIAANLTLSDMNWSVSYALTQAGLDPNSASMKPFIAYWGNTFFTDDYASLDLPNPGAVDFANACHDAGAMLFYLTGRHIGDPGLKNGMGLGTALDFTNRGFPFWKGRCELKLKKIKTQTDVDYKTEALTEIKSLKGQVVATFDNEPANAVLFQQHFPDALNFWVKTTWNPKDNPAMDGLNIISDFSEWKSPIPTLPY